MFGLSELKQTKVYQEALQEGELKGRQIGQQEGRQEGELTVILRLLSRRIGADSGCAAIAPQTEAQIRQLSLDQLEALSEALLDFASSADLEAWLRT